MGGLNLAIRGVAPHVWRDSLSIEIEDIRRALGKKIIGEIELRIANRDSGVSRLLITLDMRTILDGTENLRFGS